MAFRDILKKQRESGKGLISSIASASNKSMLESVDPRNKIFKKGSLLNSLFPNVKGYKAEGGKSLSTAITPTQTPVAVFAGPVRNRGLERGLQAARYSLVQRLRCRKHKIP